VEEHVDLLHSGAALKDGLFSRVDYQVRAAKGASFRSLTATLPPGAHDVYYRDVIGNISTSHVRDDGEKGVVLELEPRFPMFGGWNTAWHHGYNLAARRVLAVDAETGTYRLTVPANVPFQDAVVDEYTVKVVLPEGATDIRVEWPLQTVSESRSTRFTYLDFVTGRPVLKLRARNVVDAAKGDLVVTYSVPALNWLREPALLVAAAFLVFLSVSLGSRASAFLTLATSATAGAAGKVKTA
jgi:oligosaccharyltransferase complex subunit alpha (ribophorin I)